MKELENIDDPLLLSKSLQKKLEAYKAKKKAKGDYKRPRARSKKRRKAKSSVKKLSVKKKKKVVKQVRVKQKPKTVMTKEMLLERTELKTAVTKLFYMKKWGKLLFDSLKLEGKMTDGELLEFLIQAAAQSNDFKQKFPIGTPLILRGEYKLVQGVTDYGKAVLSDLRKHYCNYCRRQMYDTVHKSSIENIKNLIQVNETRIIPNLKK